MGKNLLTGLALAGAIILACPAAMFAQQMLAVNDPYAAQKKALEWQDTVEGSRRWGAVMDSAAGAASLLFAMLPWVLVIVCIVLLAQYVMNQAAKRQDMMNRAVEGMFAIREYYNDSMLKRLWQLFMAKPIQRSIVNQNSAGAITIVGGQPTQLLAATNAADDMAIRSRFMLVQAQIGQQRKPTVAEVKAQVGAKGYTPWLEPVKAQPARLPVLEDDEEEETALALPDIRWTDALASEDDSCIPIGWSKDQHEVASWKFRKDPHFLVLGKSGAGKSLYIGLPLVLGWLQRGYPAFVLDPEGGKDFAAVDRWALVAPLDTHDYTVNEHVWDRIEEEFERRKAIMDRQGVNNYLLSDLPPLGVFFEEFQQYYTGMVARHPATAERMVDVLGRIDKAGRKYGIHMVLWAQQTDKVPREVMLNMTSATLKQTPKAASIMQVFPAASNLAEGDFLYEGEEYASWRIVKFKDEPGGIKYGNVRVNEDFVGVLRSIPDTRSYFKDSPLLNVELLTDSGLRTVAPDFGERFAPQTKTPAPAPVVEPPLAPPDFDGPWVTLTEEWLREHPTRVTSGKLERGDVSAVARLIYEADGGDYVGFPTESAAYNGKKSTAGEHLYALLDRIAADPAYRATLLS